jgi:hypothetical protein
MNVVREGIQSFRGWLRGIRRRKIGENRLHSGMSVDDSQVGGEQTALLRKVLRPVGQHWK